MIVAALALLAVASPAPAKTPSAAQVAARQRMQQCSKQYQADKTAKKIAAGQTWPRYYSACSKKLKG